MIGRLIFTFAVLIAYGAITFNVTSRQFSPTGDEPHYLVITHSLATDGDISLLNNYQEQHYRIFYPSLLAKRTTASADKKREIPTFGLGMPLFLVPLYKYAYYNEPHRLVLYLRLGVCAVAVFGLYHLLALAQSLTGKKAVPFLIVGGAAFASPLVTYSSQFYPEIFAFSILVISLRALHSQSVTPRFSSLLLSFTPGILVWLHPKYLALAVVLTAITAFFLHMQKKSIAFRALHLAIALSGIASFFLFLHDKYGSWSPNRIYGGWQKQASLVDLLQQEGIQRLGVMTKMFFGFWLDERFGLLPYAPYYVAFFTALIWCLKSKQKATYPALILLGLHLLPLCWGAPLGGYAPPGRHFVVMIPLLLTPVFLLYSKWISEQKALFTTLQLAALFIAFQMFMNYRKIFANVTWRNPDGGSEFWPLLHLERWIPNCIATQPEYGLVAAWVVFVALFAFLLYPRASAPAGAETVS